MEVGVGGVGADEEFDDVVGLGRVDGLGNDAAAAAAKGGVVLAGGWRLGVGVCVWSCRDLRLVHVCVCDCDCRVEVWMWMLE